MKFDLAKAQAGHSVEKFKNLTLDDAFAVTEEYLWNDLNAHFIGEDIGGNIIYQINKKSGDNLIYTCIQSINPRFLRMKPKYKTWWFRTAVFKTGEPNVIVRESKEELLNLELPNGLKWVEEPYSKMILDKSDEHTC